MHTGAYDGAYRMVPFHIIGHKSMVGVYSLDTFIWHGMWIDAWIDR